MSNLSNPKNSADRTEEVSSRNGSHQTDCDCEGSRDPNGSRQKRWCDKVQGFLLGILVTGILTGVLNSLVSPMFAWVESKRDALLCPNPFWCDTHLEFKSTTGAQCQIGDIGYLLGKAIDDGDIESNESDSHSLAARTYLCSDYRLEKGRASSHLHDLAYDYSDCFEYVAKRHQKDVFRVKTGDDSQACVSNINVNPSTGMLEGGLTFRQGRVFCFPDKILKGSEVEGLGLRSCSRDVLETVMPNHVLVSSN